MNITTGEMFFYGGIAGTVLFSILFIVTWAGYNRKKKKMVAKIEDEMGMS